ncbi:MAG: DUF2254 domain-containing protein [Gemmatimonadota bacterium]
MPATIVCGCVIAAVVLIDISTLVSTKALAQFPRLFGAGAAGARGMLSTIAGSMITVAGVTFSITIAAVAQTSAQYTPRVLRTFMSDRANQTVLGSFLGIFAYCLVVLRTIRGGDEGAFVPPTAVLGGFLLALVGVAVLMYFIVHITQSLEAESVLDRVRSETERAIDRRFPHQLGEAVEVRVDAAPPSTIRSAWRPMLAHKSGYVEHVDEEGLLAFACDRGLVIEMLRGVGAFAVAGTALARVATSLPRGQTTASGNDEEADRESIEHELNRLYAISPVRSFRQDAAFGIVQLVDIAIKALSPGVNDTTTAVTSLGHLTAVLARLAPRRMPEPIRLANGVVRVIAISPTFSGLVGQALDDVRRSADGNVTILDKLIEALRTVGECTRELQRRQVLAEQIRFIAELIPRTVEAPEDRAFLVRRTEIASRQLSLPLTT